MSEPRRNARIFDMPGTYRIRVAARLTASWSDVFAGMTIAPSRLSDGAWATTLTGSLPDQAALAGILCTLHDWGLPLLSLERIEG
jgi:hypothetical protein